MGKMKVLLLLYLGAFLAALATALRDPPRRSPCGYIAILKRKMNTLCNKVGTLENKVETCCDLSSSQPETVFAQMELSGSHTFWIRETIKFNTAIANVGDAYDPISGQFEAPVNGTYLFSASMCSLTNDKWFHFHIMQDGNRLTWVTVGDRNLGECGSATAVTYMMKGSVVYVEIGNAIESPLTIQARHTFTAALLNTYSKP